MCCYIYGLVDPRNGNLRYVGKTERKLSVRLNHHMHRALKRGWRNTHKNCWIRALHREGLTPSIVAIFECDDELFLSEAEVFWIGYFRGLGFSLTNATDGGEGCRGYKHTEESRKKMSKAKVGRLMPEEQKKLRRTLSEEQEQFVVDSYLKGLSCSSIAKQMGNITDGGVRKILLRHGVTLRKPWAKGRKSPLTKIARGSDEEKAILMRYKAGERSSAIAKDYGISPRLVLIIKNRDIGHDQEG